MTTRKQLLLIQKLILKYNISTDMIVNTASVIVGRLFFYLFCGVLITAQKAESTEQNSMMDEFASSSSKYSTSAQHSSSNRANMNYIHIMYCTSW